MFQSAQRVESTIIGQRLNNGRNDITRHTYLGLALAGNQETEVRYEGLYWSDELDLSVIKRALRVYGIGHTAPKVVDAWQVDGNEIGVPRQWAMSKGLQGEDKTVYPPCKWPHFNASYRDNQEECVDLLFSEIQKTNGVLLESPTGWGKTIAAINVASLLQTPALVLVHKQDLVEQWQKSAMDFFGVKSGRVQQNTWDYKHPLTVAMIQTLDAREFPKDFSSSFGLVIVDEGHHTPCDTFINVMAKLPAKYRLGVSATWRRRDELQVLWEWHIGKIAARGTKKLVPGKFYQIPVKIPISDEKFTRRGNVNHSALISAIAESPGLNAFVVAEVKKAIAKGRNVLVVSHRVSQIEELSRSFPDAGIYTGKFNGKIQKKPELIAAAEKQLILASYTKIAEGTDIPRLDTLILATPCGDPEQVVGRVTRYYPGKKELVIVDPVVPTGYNYALAAKRKKVYVRLGLTQG